MDIRMKNKCVLMEEIKECSDKPMNRERAAYLSMCMGAYKAVCMTLDHKEAHGMDVSPAENSKPHFNRQMAEEWVSRMQNADGTRGPHFSIEKSKEIMKQYNVDCDPVEFWAVLNSLYSDYDQALKKNNASTLELYACLAKAWIEDQDAVPNKAAAYYTHVVKH